MAPKGSGGGTDFAAASTPGILASRERRVSMCTLLLRTSAAAFGLGSFFFDRCRRSRCFRFFGFGLDFGFGVAFQLKIWLVLDSRGITGTHLLQHLVEERRLLRIDLRRWRLLVAEIVIAVARAAADLRRLAVHHRYHVVIHHAFTAHAVVVDIVTQPDF